MKGRKKGRWTNGRWTNGRWTNGRATNGRTTAGRLTTCPPTAPPRNPSARAAVGVSARLAVSVREAVVTLGPLFMAYSLLLRRQSYHAPRSWRRQARALRANDEVYG